MKFVVNVSGGLSSFEALRRTLDRYKQEDVFAIFADTKIEDPDLYRFLNDIERVINFHIIRLEDGRTPFDVWKDRRVIKIKTTAMCSHYLKRNVCNRWLSENMEGLEYTQVFGYMWDEPHRIERLAKEIAPIPLWAPLAEPPYEDRCSLMQKCRDVGIEPPRLYEMGFAHNNCGGGCVRAGKAHWAHLYHTLPDVYAYWERQEAEFLAYIGRDDATIMIDRKMKKGEKSYTPLPLSLFRQQIEAGSKYDKDDWGGCGCFVSGLDDE